MVRVASDWEIVSSGLERDSMTTPWDKLSGESRGALKGCDSVADAYNAGHRDGVHSGAMGAVSRHREDIATAALADWLRADGTAAGYVTMGNGVGALASLDDAPAAVAYGSTNLEARHWLAYRLGLCERPGAPF